MSHIERLSREVRELLFDELDLKSTPEDFPLDEPLLDRAGRPVPLAIDSLGMMLMVLRIEEEYGVRFPVEIRELSEIFTSIRSVAENIARLQVEARVA
jgi:acyl carrier protein